MSSWLVIKNLDMDALGSAVGMQLFSSNVLDESYVVYDAEQMSPDIHRAIQFLENEGVTKLIPLTQAMGMVTNRSLLVMVDHSKTALTLSKEFYDLFTQTIILTTIDEIRISQKMLLSPISRVEQVARASL